MLGCRQGIQKQQSHALDLARKKFFIPAARMIMGAIYDSRYLRDAQLAASSELAKLLEANRDVRLHCQRQGWDE